MEYRRLGNSGLAVSVVGLGTNNFGSRCDAEQSAAVVYKALDLGINFFDTADIYGGVGFAPTERAGRGLAEEYLGKALKGVRRNVIIATKFARPMGEGPLWRGTSRRYIYYALYDSLRRLNTDYIDVYYVHLPDPQTPIEETLRALDDLVRQGLIRYTGCSSFTAAQIVEAQQVAAAHFVPFITAQNRYNLLDRRIEQELIPVCAQYGLGVVPFFPLASGFLTGKYRPGQPPPEDSRLAAAGPMAARVRDWLSDRNFAILHRLEAFAQSRGHSVLDLAIGWLASQSVISSVIAGATKPEQVEANVRAAAWRLTPEEMTEVDALTREAAD